MHSDGPPANDPDAPGSVSRLILPLREGDGEAVGTIWRYFYQSLVEIAARRLDDALHAAIGPTPIRWTVSSTSTCRSRAD
jgi:hypothetical protein